MRVLIILVFILPVFVVAQEQQTQSITIKRDACDGSCPTYSMTVFADGTYFWLGEENVAKKGYLYGKFQVNKYEQAMQVLNAAKYQEYRDRYHFKEDGCKEVWTDNPAVHILVKTLSSTKEISYYHGCRGFTKESELHKLEKKIDEIFETNKLIINTAAGAER
jgi:hypothetical protein